MVEEEALAGGYKTVINVAAVSTPRIEAASPAVSLAAQLSTNPIESWDFGE